MHWRTKQNGTEHLFCLAKIDIFWTATVQYLCRGLYGRGGAFSTVDAVLLSLLLHVEFVSCLAISLLALIRHGARLVGDEGGGEGGGGGERNGGVIGGEGGGGGRRQHW